MLSFIAQLPLNREVRGLRRRIRPNEGSPWKQLADRLRSLLIECESTNMLPVKDAAVIDEFINVGEYGLAFETLDTQLYERGAQISEDILRELTKIGAELHIEPVDRNLNQ